MANKDHSLDNKIYTAAKNEFLELGFQKASLHKIAAKANVTTGALYTRYKSKDDLFFALIEPVFDSFKPFMKEVMDKYYKAQSEKNVEGFIEAMRFECDIYFKILFEHKDESTLLLLKSSGSEVDSYLKKMIDYKKDGTIKFFEEFAKEKSERENNPNIMEDFLIDKNAISMLMNMQFPLFNGVLELDVSKEDAKKCMDTMIDFLILGWKNLFEKYM